VHLPFWALLSRTYSFFSLSNDSIELWKQWEDALNSMCEEVEACEGATELVQALANASLVTDNDHDGNYGASTNATTTTRKNGMTKLPMAIATSSRLTNVQRKRCRHEETIFQYMDSIVTGDDPFVTHGKPAPDIYLEASKRLGLLPKECLAFEDAITGVRSAKAAGCYVVAIPDSRYTKEEKKQIFEVEADIVLDTLWEFDGTPFGIQLSNIIQGITKKS